MKAIKKKVDSKIYLLPIILSCIFIIFFILSYFSNKPVADLPTDITKIGKENVEMSVSIIQEMNKYLVSISTALFGVCGFFLNNNKNNINKGSIGYAYLISLIFLGLSFFYAFNVYAGLTNNIVQGKISLTPGTSDVLFDLEMEFLTCSLVATQIFFIYLLFKHPS